MALEKPSSEKSSPKTYAAVALAGLALAACGSPDGQQAQEAQTGVTKGQVENTIPELTEIQVEPRTNPKTTLVDESIRSAENLASELVRAEKSEFLAQYGELLSPGKAEELWVILVSLGDFLEGRDQFQLEASQAYLVACLYMHERSVSSEYLFNEDILNKMKSVRALLRDLLSQGWGPEIDTEPVFQIE